MKDIEPLSHPKPMKHDFQVALWPELASLLVLDVSRWCFARLLCELLAHGNRVSIGSAPSTLSVAAEIDRRYPVTP